MWKCKHCELEFRFEKTAEKANHSRWCDRNPKKTTYRNNETLGIAVRSSTNKKYGLKTEYQVTCAKCNALHTVIERSFSFPSKVKYFCSRTCGNSHEVTAAHRIKTSETLTGKVYAPPTLLEKVCPGCNTTFSVMEHYTIPSKTYCNRSCGATHGNKERNTVSRANRPALVNYRADCKFKFGLSDYPAEFDFALIEEHGWYKPKNRGDNLTGVSRDHMVSVRYGFDNNIPAEHLRHPANCRLLTHSKNVSKGINNSVTYDELLLRIAKWDLKYNT